MRLLVLCIQPADISDLPHGWLTFLEAAYEHQDDTQALLRLATIGKRCHKQANKHFGEGYSCDVALYH